MADSPAEEPSESPAPRLPTALVYDPAMLGHLVPDEFPETPERMRFTMAMIDALVAAGTLPAEKLLRLDARLATLDDLSAVHAPEYIERARIFVERLMEGHGYDAPPRRFACRAAVVTAAQKVPHQSAIRPPRNSTRPRI